MKRWPLLLAVALLCAQVTAAAHSLDHLDVHEQCSVCLVGTQFDDGHGSPVLQAVAAPLLVHGMDTTRTVPATGSTWGLPNSRGPPQAIPLKA